VVFLVAGGIGLALPFRHGNMLPGALRPTETAVVDVPLRRADVKLDVSRPGEASPAAQLLDQDETLADRYREARPDLAALLPPPILPEDFGQGGAGQRPVMRRDWKPARLKLQGSRPTLRRHRLTDGDTLERLAERYLGDAARADEIFAINRDLLGAPDLLPLGKIIRIPSSTDDLLES
jgi:nucleoid-associated protein YgaU